MDGFKNEFFRLLKSHKTSKICLIEAYKKGHQHGRSRYLNGIRSCLEKTNTPNFGIPYLERFQKGEYERGFIKGFNDTMVIEYDSQKCLNERIAESLKNWKTPIIGGDGGSGHNNRCQGCN